MGNVIRQLRASSSNMTRNVEEERGDEEEVWENVERGLSGTGKTVEGSWGKGKKTEEKDN